MRTMSDLEVREEKYSAETKSWFKFVQGEAIFLYF